MLFSSTSSQNTSRSATPINARSGNRDELDMFFYSASKSKFINTIIWMLAILFTILAFSKLPTYCTGNSDFKGCRKCPEHAIPSMFSFVCNGSYVKVGDKCLTKDDELIETSKKIKSIIGIKRIVDLDFVQGKLDNATIDQLNKSIDYLKDYEIVGSEIRKKNYGISQFTVCLVLSVVFYFILFLFQGLKKKYNFMY